MSVTVNVDNFVEAETARMFAGVLHGAGAMARFRHVREPAPIDDQSVIRLNRDTLYSSMLLDLAAGPARLTLPDSGARYLSAMVLNESHHVTDIVHGAGTFTLDRDSAGSRYVVLAVRTLVDPSDPDDVAAVGRLQDALRVEAAEQHTFTLAEYDTGSFDATRAALLTLADGLTDYNGMFGSADEVDPVRHLIGTASGWGGLPTREAVYLSVNPHLPPGTYELAMRDVPVDAFWSVSVYNADGFFERNDDDAYSINSLTGQRDPDGTVRLWFVPAPGTGIPNSIPVPEGWNYMIRLYRPRAEVLAGRWRPPEPVRASDP